MELEQRGTRSYYYRKERIGGRVVSCYVGGGELAHLAGSLAAIDRERRELERYEREADRLQFDAVEKDIHQVIELRRVLLAATLLTNGYHTHNGQWRRRREARNDETL